MPMNAGLLAKAVNKTHAFYPLWFIKGDFLEDDSHRGNDGDSEPILGMEVIWFIVANGFEVDTKSSRLANVHTYAEEILKEDVRFKLHIGEAIFWDNSGP